MVDFNSRTKKWGKIWQETIDRLKASEHKTAHVVNDRVDVEDLKEKLANSTKHNFNVTVWMMAVLLYIALSLTAFDDINFFSGQSMVRLPILEITISARYYLLIAPFIIFAFHCNVILHLANHKILLERWKGKSRCDSDMAANPFLYNFWWKTVEDEQVHVSNMLSSGHIHLNRLEKTLLGLLVFFTCSVFPVMLMIFCVWKFCVYQQLSVSVFHFIIVGISLYMMHKYHQSNLYPAKSGVSKLLVKGLAINKRFLWGVPFGVFIFLFNVKKSVKVIRFPKLTLYNVFFASLFLIMIINFISLKKFGYDGLGQYFNNFKMHIDIHRGVIDYRVLPKDKREITNRLTIKNRSLNGASLVGSTIRGVDFEGVDFASVSFENTKLQSVNFFNCKNLGGFHHATLLDSVSIIDCKFSNPDFRHTSLKNVAITLKDDMLPFFLIDGSVIAGRLTLSYDSFDDNTIQETLREKNIFNPNSFVVSWSNPAEMIAPTEILIYKYKLNLDRSFKSAELKTIRTQSQLDSIFNDSNNINTIVYGKDTY